MWEICELAYLDEEKFIEGHVPYYFLEKWN